MVKFNVFSKILAVSFFALFLNGIAFSQGINNAAATSWVDSVFATLTPDDRIAQLLMLRAYSNRDSIYVDELSDLVKNVKIGGVCFFQGGPVRQAMVTNRLQSLSRTPLFIAIDGEWGPGMRLDSVSWFPKQLTLGAIHSDSLIYEMGADIARQMKRLGVQINFAPVADVNNNPLNPVINARSFGQDRENVAVKACWYMKGMQDNGLIAVAKHFPGHGDTGNDSHYTLPLINKSLAEIDSIELFPFKYLINNGVKGVMVSHLAVPALDTSARSIATLSSPIINDLLRNKLGFQGMVITDAMDMKGLTNFSDPGMVEAEALKAGNDILLLPIDARVAITNIRRAIDSGYISQSLIDDKCKRVLNWKYESGLGGNCFVNTSNLTEDLNSPKASLITRRANTEAITLVNDARHIIPLKSLESCKIASVVIGDTSIVPFQEALSDYAPVTHFHLPRDPGKNACDSILRLLEPFNLVITGFVKTSDLPQKKFGIYAQGIAFADSLCKIKETVLCLFSSPYALASFSNIDNYAATIVAYQDNAVMQSLTAQAVFGGIAVGGRLPVTSTDKFPVGSGLDRDPVRLAFTIPEEVGISSHSLQKVDSIVMAGIESGAFPGAQLVAVKDGKVFYRKAFGSFTYGSDIPLKNDDLFDLASLTKVFATTLTAMKLTGDGLIDPGQKLSHYFKPLRKSNKSHLIIREIMAHQAGLQPYIPFYKKIQKEGYSDSLLFRTEHGPDFTLRVAQNFYMNKDFRNTIIDSIIKSPLLKKHEYKYSDLGFILLAESFKQITSQDLNVYVQQNFYNRMGLPTMGYLPRERFDLNRIAPTENDTLFRHQLVHGDVHDPTAAMLGGVAGHAGLFSDALDVAVIMQMLLQKGVYGGEVYLDTAVVADFTKVQFAGNNNRRGMGFDKPALIPGQPGPTCDSASPASFGHTGFTGTYAWADPVNNLIYVFLSNRVFPDAGNNKITQMNIRTRIHEAIYEAITKGM
ncbi:MAG: serine hydrolase [Lentimicrobiaceae bacterium]|nr:serine hydrolase [Lentimicrobiaceae bacterium]